MVRSCIPNVAQLSQLFSSYTSRKPSSDVFSQQVCESNDIPYSSWKPPICPQKCQGRCPQLPVGNEVRVNGQLMTEPSKQQIMLPGRKEVSWEETKVEGSVSKHMDDHLSSSCNVFLINNDAPVLATKANDGTSSCLSLTWNVNVPPINEKATPNGEYHAKIAGEGKTSISGSISSPQAQYESVTSVAQSCTHDLSHNLDHQSSSPFDDDTYDLSSLIQEDEVNHEMFNSALASSAITTSADCQPRRLLSSQGGILSSTPRLSSHPLSRSREISPGSATLPRRAKDAIGDSLASTDTQDTLELDGAQDTTLNHVFFF